MSGEALVENKQIKKKTPPKQKIKAERKIPESQCKKQYLLFPMFLLTLKFFQSLFIQLFHHPLCRIPIRDGRQIFPPHVTMSVLFCL